MYNTKASGHPRRLFFLMFSITLLLNINFTILRSVRNTLAVVDLGTSASTIPIFELFGALPCSILLTGALSWLMSRMAIHRVFFIIIALFLGFFLIFGVGLYPILVDLRNKGEIGSAILQLFSMLFYVMGELWKPSLAIILFWGLVNQHIPLAEAKKLYAPLMLSGSLGAVLAGPIVSLCTSEFLWNNFSLSSERWTHALMLLMYAVTILGVAAAILYHQLSIYFSQHSKEEGSSDCQSFSLKESVYLCFQVPQLRLLAWIVIADYIAYSLGEVIFLDILKTRFPDACAYCNYMGSLSLWSGVLTVISALLVTPYILRNCNWVVAALATPLCLLITEGSFFIFLRGNPLNGTWFGWTESEWVWILVVLGSLQYCLCRAVKYTLFDSSKELAFVLMPPLQKMKGKLVIDGICARLGRGGASALSICLIGICGGVLASSLAAGVIAIGMTVSWALTTCKLGRLLDKEPIILEETI